MAQIERVNYDSYIKPLEHIQKAHNDTLADMANMSQQSEILDYYLDPNLDKESYSLYNNFKQEFNNQADDFARNGLTRSNGTKLLNLHRNYNRNVANVIDAVKNREAERAEQHKLFADSNGQVVFGKEQNADYKSVDDYLHGNKGYIFQNLDEVYKYAKNQAAAASKREYKDGVADAVRVLDNNYYKILEETGYNTQAAYEKLDAMMNDVANQMDLTYNPNNDPSIDPKDNPAGLIRNMREELRRRGLENYSNEDKHKIISSFLTGTYEGLGYDPKLTLKDTPEMRQKGATSTRVYVDNGKPPKDNMTWTWDEITLPSTFTSNIEEQKSTYDIISANQKSYYQDIMGDYGGGQHYIKSFEKWYKDTKGVVKDSDGVWRGNSGKITEAGVNAARNEYNSKKNSLQKRFHLRNDQIKTMEAPQNAKETFESITAEQIKLNEANTQPHKVAATNLKFPDSDLKNVIQRALTRYAEQNGRRPLMNLGYNGSNGTYSFADDADVADEVLESKAMGGAIVRLIYAPQKRHDENPLWVEFKIYDVNKGKSFFLPLSALSSYSEAQKSNVLEELSQRRDDILIRNKDLFRDKAKEYGYDIDKVTLNDIDKLVLKIKSDKNIKDKATRNAYLDMLAQIDESLEWIDFYKKQRNRAANNGANSNVKPINYDFNQKPARQEQEK